MPSQERSPTLLTKVGLLLEWMVDFIFPPWKLDDIPVVKEIGPTRNYTNPRYPGLLPHGSPSVVSVEDLELAELAEYAELAAMVRRDGTSLDNIVATAIDGTESERLLAIARQQRQQELEETFQATGTNTTMADTSKVVNMSISAHKKNKVSDMYAEFVNHMAKCSTCNTHKDVMCEVGAGLHVKAKMDIISFTETDDPANRPSQITKPDSGSGESGPPNKNRKVSRVYKTVLKELGRIKERLESIRPQFDIENPSFQKFSELVVAIEEASFLAKDARITEVRERVVGVTTTPASNNAQPDKTPENTEDDSEFAIQTWGG